MANVSSHVALYKPATTRIINWVCGTTLAPISTTQGPDGTIEISLADFGTAVNDIKNRGVQLPKQTDRDFSVAIEHRTNATEVYMVIEGNTPSQETLGHIQFTSILQDAHTRLRANGSTASSTGSIPPSSSRFHLPQSSSQVAASEMRNIFDILLDINCESTSPRQPSPQPHGQDARGEGIDDEHRTRQINHAISSYALCMVKQEADIASGVVIAREIAQGVIPRLVGGYVLHAFYTRLVYEKINMRIDGMSTIPVFEKMIQSLSDAVSNSHYAALPYKRILGGEARQIASEAIEDFHRRINDNPAATPTVIFSIHDLLPLRLPRNGPVTSQPEDLRLERKEAIVQLLLSAKKMNDVRVRQRKWEQMKLNKRKNPHKYLTSEFFIELIMDMVPLADMFPRFSSEDNNKIEGCHHVALTAELLLETTIAFAEAGGLGAHDVIRNCARRYAMNVIAEIQHFFDMSSLVHTKSGYVEYIDLRKVCRQPFLEPLFSDVDLQHFAFAQEIAVHYLRLSSTDPIHFLSMANLQCFQNVFRVATEAGTLLIDLEGICASVLHVYNALDKRGALPTPINILERLCVLFGGHIFKDKTRPSSKFSSHWRVYNGFDRKDKDGIPSRFGPRNRSECTETLRNNYFAYRFPLPNYLNDPKFREAVASAPLNMAAFAEQGEEGRRAKRALVTAAGNNLSCEDVALYTMKAMYSEFEGNFPLARVRLFQVFKTCLNFIIDVGNGAAESNASDFPDVAIQFESRWPLHNDSPIRNGLEFISMAFAVLDIKSGNFPGKAPCKITEIPSWIFLSRCIVKAFGRYSLGDFLYPEA